MSINRDVFRLTIPNMISNLTVPILATVDTALMGHLSAAHLGAAGLATNLFSTLYWNFGFLRASTTGLTAQSFGANDKRESGAILIRSLCLSFLGAALFLLFQNPLYDAGSWLLAVPDSANSLVRDYFDIRLWGAPAGLGIYSMMGWFFGLQNAWVPMVLTIVITVLNLFFSYVLVAFYDLGIQGIAIGTVVSQYVGFILATVFAVAMYRDRLSAIQWADVFERSQMLRLFRVNRDIILRTLCLTFVFAYLHRVSATQSEVVLAANVILIQMTFWMSYGIDGFAYAGESLAGRFYGAKDGIRLRQSIELIFKWGGILAIVCAAGFAIFPKSLLGMFTNDASVVDAAIPFIPWLAASPIIGLPTYLWDGIFIGLTATHWLRNSMVAATVVFLAVEHWLVAYWGNHALWFAFICFLLVRSVIQTAQFLRAKLFLHLQDDVL